MRPQPLTPPPERYGASPDRSDGTQHSAIHGSDDNTAAGMALSQEESMYLTPAYTPDRRSLDTDSSGDKDKMDTIPEAPKVDGQVAKLTVSDDGETQDHDDGNSIPASPVSLDVSQNGRPQSEDQPFSTVDSGIHHEGNLGERFHSSKLHPGVSQTRCSSSASTSDLDGTLPPGLAKVDLTLNRSSTTMDWDFTRKRLEPKYPSSLFQPFSRYRGTQQSDRQVYNVDVTILTVDMAQASLSGYLMIRGLTPEHEMLQTFFTGEIIGGPDQKYSFRTSDPAWGATDKTDMTHWARFPAWRPLSPYARRDIDFRYPLDNESWWQQEHIFMRWKEHFLVPDHKTRSIQGASFEGFYYICLNQITGNISGIYFHSKSEKYQQLDLKHEGKHEGKRGVWGPGYMPSVEFR